MEVVSNPTEVEDAPKLKPQQCLKLGRNIFAEGPQKWVKKSIFQFILYELNWDKKKKKVL